ncbi:mRNA-binding ubiquitin-specific protease UBP3 [Sporobolomyces koalae]|uniref:mRNA-binding ubiquitin-specific protease UBP3 n=1 Tax=Sporobolomyces koalae TaxID=500713 RepID=UPI003181766C
MGTPAPALAPSPSAGSSATAGPARGYPPPPPLSSSAPAPASGSASGSGSTPTPGSAAAPMQPQPLHRKLNPNSQAFSFLQPDSVPPASSFHSSAQAQTYDYPISNYIQPQPANGYYHALYPITSQPYAHRWPSTSNGSPAASSSYPPIPPSHHLNSHSPHSLSHSSPSSHSSHSHLHSHSHSHTHSLAHSHSHNHSLNHPHSTSTSHPHPHPSQSHSHAHPAPLAHAPSYYQQSHHSAPPPPRASNGIFLPLTHNGPHHLASPSHSPYLAPQPPIPATHPPYSPQRPLAPVPAPVPAAVHLATTPSLPVSPATPLPPPSIAATSFFATPPPAPAYPVSFATPSVLEPQVSQSEQPAALSDRASAPSLSIAHPPAQAPPRRHRKSRLPSPRTFTYLTLAPGVVPSAGYKFPVYPDKSATPTATPVADRPRDVTSGADANESEAKPLEEEKEERSTETAASVKSVEAPPQARKEEPPKQEEPPAAVEEPKSKTETIVEPEAVVSPSKPASTPAVPATSPPATDVEADAVKPAAPATPKAPAPKPKMKSWADLVRPPPGSTPPASSSGVTPISASLASAPPPPTAPASSLLAALAAPPSHVHKPSPPLPRGLINNGNLCFANAILQALVYCGAFWETLRAVEAGSRADLRSNGQKGRSAVEAMIAFLGEFRNASHSAAFDAANPNPAASSSTPSSSSNLSSFATADPSPSTSTASPRPSTSRYAHNHNSGTLTPLPSLSPTPIHDALSSNPRFDAMRRGTQEDAEEFLGFFLETLSEEVSEIVKREEERVSKLGGGPGDKGKEKQVVTEDEGEGGWAEVGSKGRIATTRTTGDTKDSPITRIFGGKSRSVLRCPGQKDSVTIEPFQRLQLDIQPDHVRTIEDALLNLTTPEPLPDYATARGTITQDATKQFTLDELPPVLILHLKRFLYDEVVGSQKCTKKIGYSTHLRIDEKVMSPVRRNGLDKGKEVARYELFGVVYHHGLQASGGHYTVAVRTAYHAANWLELDDTHIRTLGPGEIAVNPSDSQPTTGGGGGGRRRWEATAAMRDREGMFGGEDEHKGAYLLMYAKVEDK